MFEDPNWDIQTLDFDRDLARAARADNGTLTAINADLSAFVNRGGKLVIAHGWSDGTITPYSSVNYYQSVRSALGADRTDTAIRLFMVPGGGHCGGGPTPQFDEITALDRWIETKNAPESIPAAGVVNGVTRTRPLCAYPLVATYKGSGSTDDGTNFSCAAPNARR